MLNEIVAQNIRYYRYTFKRNDPLKIGLSQEELAALSGLSPRYISDIERMVYSPSIATIEQISIALKIEPKLLFESNSNAQQLPEDVEKFRTSYIQNNL